MMMKQARVMLVPLLAVLSITAESAGLEFATPFTTGTVLQRDVPIVIHG